jgi:RNA polymerase sigma-70 factor (ECF subfamily)
MTWSVETEKTVIRNARAGDSDAFGMLYDNYSQSIYRRCLRLTGDSVAAEDLSQDVFIQAWRKISTFRGDSRFGTWLHRVTTNIVFMYFREKRRHSAQDQYIALTGDGWSFEERLSSGPPQLDNRLVLNETVSTLRPGYRAVLMLHDIGGYKHHEIARMLDIPAGTSKSNLYRAHRQIRLCLNRLSAPQEGLGAGLAVP